MELEAEKLENLKVVPTINNKPIPGGELVGEVLSVISFKDPDVESDPEHLVKRNSYRDVHRPNVAQLDWVSQSFTKQEVSYFIVCPMQCVARDRI